MILGHAGVVAPNDLWSAWQADPVVVLGLLLAGWAYGLGRTPGARRRAETWRARAFVGALLAIGVALLSPLDALSAALASAHMVQHLLLVLVAAPLLAVSAPSSRLLRGSPLVVRRAVSRARRGLRRAAPGTFRWHPGAVWLLHVAVLWLWHAAALYDAALMSPVVHVAEHATMLATGVLFWWVVIGTRGAARVSPGLGVMLVFGMALQGTFLSLLLTFARTPWYAGYAATTAPWGLEPLADQQLAGVIMWVPAGMVYLAAALALLVTWVGSPERVELPARAGERSGSGLRTARSEYEPWGGTPHDRHTGRPARRTGISDDPSVPAG